MLPVVLPTSLSELGKVFFPIDSKEQKLIMPLVITLKLYMEFNMEFIDFNLGNVISNLKKLTNFLLNWFRENHMKANTDKCHLLVSSGESCTTKVEDIRIRNSTEEKQLRVKLILFFSLQKDKPEITSSCKNIKLNGLK